MAIRFSVAATALVLITTACGADGAPSTTTATEITTTMPAPPATTTPATTAPVTTTPGIPPGDELPPADFDALAAVFDPIVEPFGYRVGRAALIDRATYRETPDGDHLALYLTPLFAKTPDDYVTDFVPLARGFMPAVFDAWPGLMSFDVCQEPYEWEGSTSPPGLTILDVDRRAAAEIDWATVDLSGLLEADRTLEGLDIHAQREIRDTAAWSAAAEG